MKRITRTARTIHLWLALPAGLFIFLLCASGSLMILCGGDSPFGHMLFRLHRWLMDAPAARGDMTPGKMIVALSTVACILIVITGLILWWPSAKVNLGRSLTLRFRGPKGAVLHSLHAAPGVWCSLFLLVMGLTGLTWSFGWYRDAFGAAFGYLGPDQLRHLIHGLHMGTLWAPVTRWLWCAAALLGATLPISGFILWIRRLHR